MEDDNEISRLQKENQRLSLEKEAGKQAKTNNDMPFSHYTMVAGNHFN